MLSSPSFPSSSSLAAFSLSTFFRTQSKKAWMGLPETMAAAPSLGSRAKFAKMELNSSPEAKAAVRVLRLCCTWADRRFSSSLSSVRCPSGRSSTRRARTAGSDRIPLVSMASAVASSDRGGPGMPAPAAAADPGGVEVANPCMAPCKSARVMAPPPVAPADPGAEAAAATPSGRGGALGVALAPVGAGVADGAAEAPLVRFCTMDARASPDTPPLPDAAAAAGTVPPVRPCMMA
mmetsp:Transcript_2545/g.7469  ORF Transcript_2545/g.7469 Transcript_2545/m.7469 type:complete len:235 (+) Transcript_2545:108-812(+)